MGSPDVLAAAARAAGLGPLRRLADLGGSQRSEVVRVTDGEQTYVVKTYLDDHGDTWAREPAALAALAGAPVPMLLGVADEPRLVVMGDVGQHDDMAGRFLGADPDAAEAALMGWVAALAALHGVGAGAVAAYADGLAARAPGRALQTMPDEGTKAAGTLAELLPGLPQEGLEALRQLTGSLSGDGVVVSPGDICPDNNMLTPDGVVLLDLEWAEARPLVWDVAYLAVPWPTCWCAWLLPDDVAGRALAAYLAAAPGYPGFERDLGTATVAWCLTSAAMFLRTALGEDEHNEDTARMPGRRTMILHRLAKARELTASAELAALAGLAHDRLRGVWGDHPARLAPAWRAGSPG